jgi:hypothetical protein
MIIEQSNRGGSKMPAPPITTPIPAPVTDRHDGRAFPDARLSAVVEAAYLLQAIGR